MYIPRNYINFPSVFSVGVKGHSSISDSKQSGLSPALTLIVVGVMKGCTNVAILTVVRGYL